MANASFLYSYLITFIVKLVAGTARQNIYTIVPQAVPVEFMEIANINVESEEECCVHCQSRELCAGAIFTQGIHQSCLLLSSYSRFMKKSNDKGFITPDPGYGVFVHPQDCSELHKAGYDESGVYTVYINRSDQHTPISVYCDMTTDGGGWMVFQRRQDGSVDFYRDWEAYREGFGNVTGEFWLGNSVIHEVTAQKAQQLRVDLHDHEGLTAYAKYEHFYVGPAMSEFTLNISGYTGTAGDSLRYHNTHKFSTKDRDYNTCARTYFGAWWYNGCHYSNLNGLYAQTGNHATAALGQYVNWAHWRGITYSLKFTEMKIRPYDF